MYSGPLKFAYFLCIDPLKFWSSFDVVVTTRKVIYCGLYTLTHPIPLVVRLHSHDHVVAAAILLAHHPQSHSVRVQCQNTLAIPTPALVSFPRRDLAVAILPQ